MINSLLSIQQLREGKVKDFAKEFGFKIYNS